MSLHIKLCLLVIGPRPQRLLQRGQTCGEPFCSQMSASQCWVPLAGFGVHQVCWNASTLPSCDGDFLYGVYSASH